MKPNTNLTLADHRLLDLVWQAEPVSSPQLCKLAEEALGWKRTTTYTVIKRLTERGVVHTENAVVTALVGRQDVQNAESRAFVDKNFHGSLPAFLSAFIGNKQLTQQEADELRRMIDKFEEEHHG